MAKQDKCITMLKRLKYLTLNGGSAIVIANLTMTSIASAATPINLSHQPENYLHHVFMLQTASSESPVKLEKIRTHFDLNQTAHVRIQQTYAGIPVWDATAVIHILKANAQNNPNLLANINNKTSMNGTVYKRLEKDLSTTPSYALTDSQKATAFQKTKDNYEQESSQSYLKFTDESLKTIIFVDDNQQAHYAFLISFYLDDGKTGAHRPTFIIDATSFYIYRKWDQVMTLHDDPQPILIGGIGGNKKIGEKIYDGGTNHLPAITINGYKEFPFCQFTTDDIVVKDISYENISISTPCEIIPNQHNDISWVSLDENDTRWTADEMNDGYSPTLDVFYGATIVKKLYQDWYNIPVLVKDDGTTPMKLILRVHYGRRYDNAFWNGIEMTFGDGGNLFYPLTSLDVIAHEISHGFTSQHSNIDVSFIPMAALHEAFSDMAAAAAEFYVSGKNNWIIGSDIIKKDNDALRYMNEPTKDGRSIDNVADFSPSINPHLVAGIYNKAFYLIATSHGWDTHKAFDVMVKANIDYWNSSMKQFDDVACGVLEATKDLSLKDPSYIVEDVVNAFKKVGIQTRDCYNIK